MPSNTNAIASQLAEKWRPRVEAHAPVIRQRFETIRRMLGTAYSPADVVAHALAEVLNLALFLAIPSEPLAPERVDAYVTESRRLGVRAHGTCVGGTAIVALPSLRRIVISGEDHGYHGESLGALASIVVADFGPESIAGPAREDPALAEELGHAVWAWLRPLAD